jgi:hypothetical protein
VEEQVREVVMILPKRIKREIHTEYMYPNRSPKGISAMFEK